MPINMSPQELHESNDKFAFYGLIAWLGGVLVGCIIFAFLFIWVWKWFANNLFGCHFRPIHVVLLEILRNNTPLALYRRARIHIKEKRERRRQKADDIEKARSSKSPECSLFTLAYSSESDRDKYYSSHQHQHQPASSFSRNQTIIEKPKPVLAQHNEAWWKEQGSEDLATVIRLMQEAAYSRRASNQ